MELFIDNLRERGSLTARKYRGKEISPLRCRWYRKRRCHLCGVRAVEEGHEPHIRRIGLVRALYMPG